jgi:hypothetical protein
MAEVIDSSRPTIFQIRIGGHLGDEWTDWFEGLTITREACGDTLLTVPLVSVNPLPLSEVHLEHGEQEINSDPGERIK